MRSIAGTVGPHLSPDSLAIVGRMLTACQSGDGSSPTLLPHAVLGPEAVVSSDRQIALVIDGSLTNIADLRSQLVSAGFRLRTNDLNELLMAGVRAWTPAGLAPRLRGSFVMAVYEADPMRLTLMRDRFGSRRLAYIRREGRVHFCSAIRGLRQAWPNSGPAKDLDPAAVAEFLELGWISDDRAIYTGVEKVPAGGIVQIDLAGVSVERFWTPPRPEGDWRIGFENVCAIVESLLLESVAARLQTSASLAGLFGPGIESSLLGWAATQLDARLPFLRVAQAGEPAEQTEAARNLARRLGLRQEVIWVSALEEPRVFELADAYDEPYASPSAFQMLRVGRAVHRRASVLLAGDGVDWLFLGSPQHVRCWWMERLLRELEIDEPALIDQARSLLGLPGAFLEPGMRAGRLFGSKLRESVARPAERGVSPRLLEQYLKFDRVASFDRDRAGILGASRHYGIEARSPFLDENLWEFVGRVPYYQRLDGGRSRSILRGLAAMHAGDVFAQREKPSQAVLVRQLLASRWMPALDELLRDSHLVEEGWVDADAIRREHDSTRRRGEGSLGLWHFFVLEYWLRRAGMTRLSPAALAAAGGVPS